MEVKKNQFFQIYSNNDQIFGVVEARPTMRMQLHSSESLNKQSIETRFKFLLTVSKYAHSTVAFSIICDDR